MQGRELWYYDITRQKQQTVYKYKYLPIAACCNSNDFDLNLYTRKTIQLTMSCLIYIDEWHVIMCHSAMHIHYAMLIFT